MKRKKMSRRMAIALSAVMVIGGVSVNTYAENLDSEIEIMMEGEVITDNDEVSVADDELFLDDVAAEPMISADDVVVVDEGEIIIADVEEIIVDSSVVETETETESAVEVETEDFEVVEEELTVQVEEEMDTAEVETLLSSGEKTNVGKTTIILNYENYTLKSVGETVQLVATVLKPETEVDSELVTAETSSDDLVIIDEESDCSEITESSLVVSDIDSTTDDLVNNAPVDDDAVTVENVTLESVSEMENNVSWSSSDESVVTVDEVGIVTAVALGEAVVTCTLDADQNVIATCKISVNGECALQEHVHSRDCLVRELICSHVSEEEHTSECFLNEFVCGKEEHIHHIHDENLINGTDDVDSVDVAY